MKRSIPIKSSVLACIIAIVAALLAVAILLCCIFWPRSLPTISSSGAGSFIADTAQSSEAPIINMESSREELVSEIVSNVVSSTPSQTTNTQSQTTPPPQNIPTDIGSITPMQSRHPVAEDGDSFDITLSFVGDMILATNKDSFYSGSFRDYAAEQDPTYFLSNVRHIFEADDFTIANVENVFSDRALIPVHKDYDPAFWFISPASNINILSSSGVEGAMIANNHIRDYGTEGYNDSVAAITNAGMQYGDASRIMYFEKGGYVVAVICSGLWSESQANNIVNLIKQAENHSHYQAVIFHGGTEKIHAPEEWKQRAARKLVDNGADLVVGGHPHVLQPREIYNGVEIVYSIGNFCYGGHRYPENRTVIYQMTLNIGKDLTLRSSASNMIPCYVYTGSINNFQPAIVDDEIIKNRILDFMNGLIPSPV